MRNIFRAGGHFARDIYDVFYQMEEAVEVFSSHNLRYNK